MGSLLAIMAHCYFKSLLRRTTVTSDVKKAVDANVEFFFCRLQRACACQSM